MLSLNAIKSRVVINNQAIIGNILAIRPELEGEIVDVVTRGYSMENLQVGKDALNKYNYSDSVRLINEPIMSKALGQIFIVDWILISIVLLLVFILVLYYFKKIYEDIKDMTTYVYNSSEGIEFEMKNRNQEGQIGFLKTELLKMTNILNEKVELLNKEKVFLNDKIGRAHV